MPVCSRSSFEAAIRVNVLQVKRCGFAKAHFGICGVDLPTTLLTVLFQHSIQARFRD